jgi:hypothetical protein
MSTRVEQDRPARGRDETAPAAGGLPGALPAAVLAGLALVASNASIAVAAQGSTLATTEATLAAAERHPVAMELTSAFGMLASLLLVPATWALVLALRGRVPRLAAVGGWLTGSGYLMFTVLSADSLLLLAVSRTPGDPSVFVRAVDEHGSVTALVAYAVLGLGALVGGVVLGIAMLRHPDVPGWAGWLLVLAEPVRVAGLLTGMSWVPVVASAMLGTAFVAALRTTR